MSGSWPRGCGGGKNKKQFLGSLPETEVGREHREIVMQ